MADFATGIAAFGQAIVGDGVPPGIASSVRDDAPRRFAVYRNNVFVSLTKALKQRFPVVTRLVGEEFAAAMFGLFARTSPPSSPLMMIYGETFPAFAERFEPVRGLSYLPDVARLELARGRAYHAADARGLGVADLMGTATIAPERLVLRLHPSVSVLRSPHPVFSIWQTNREGAAPRPMDLSRAECVLIARPAVDVLTEAMGSDAAVFVTALLDGVPFAAAVTRAGPCFDPAPVLARLIAAGLIVDFGEAEKERGDGGA